MKGWKNKIFFWTVSILSLWGMMLSGTRGAMIVPALGGITYVILSKRTKVIIMGGITLVFLYFFFAYTYIGDSNYTIARMRTAFHPENDASYQVRLKNRLILKTYLAVLERQVTGDNVFHLRAFLPMWLPIAGMYKSGRNRDAWDLSYTCLSSCT